MSYCLGAFPISVRARSGDWIASARRSGRPRPLGEAENSSEKNRWPPRNSHRRSIRNRSYASILIAAHALPCWTSVSTAQIQARWRCPPTLETTRRRHPGGRMDTCLQHHRNRDGASQPSSPATPSCLIAGRLCQRLLDRSDRRPLSAHALQRLKRAVLALTRVIAADQARQLHGRLVSMDEVADAILYLASPRSGLRPTPSCPSMAVCRTSGRDDPTKGVTTRRSSRPVQWGWPIQFYPGRRHRETQPHRESSTGRWPAFSRCSLRVKASSARERETRRHRLQKNQPQAEHWKLLT